LRSLSPPDKRDRLFLGQAEIRGERGLLRISSDWLLRLRYNPFYDVLERRTLDWVAAVGDAGQSPRNPANGRRGDILRDALIR
jgi:hypothetical protein